MKENGGGVGGHFNRCTVGLAAVINMCGPSEWELHSGQRCIRVHRAPYETFFVTFRLRAPALCLNVSVHRSEAHLRPRVCTETCNLQIRSPVHCNGICIASSKGWLSLILYWVCPAKGGMEDKHCSLSQEIMPWLTAFNQSSALLKMEKAPLCQGDGIISPGTYLILLLGALFFVSNC